MPFFIPDPSLVVLGDNHFKVFKFWKRVNGRITSSMTVLSSCELEAVYDEISYPVWADEVPAPAHESSFYPTIDRDDGDEFSFDDEESYSPCDYFIHDSDKPHCSLTG